MKVSIPIVVLSMVFGLVACQPPPTPVPDPTILPPSPDIPTPYVPTVEHPVATPVTDLIPLPPDVWPDRAFWTHITSLAINPGNPSNVFVGTVDGGVYRSPDGGLNWSPGLIDPNYKSVGVVVIDPTIPSTLYAGTDRGVIKSTDGGATWFAIQSGLVEDYVMDLVIDPLYPSTLYAGTLSGVFISPDRGESWIVTNAIPAGNYVSSLAVSPEMPPRICAGTFTGGVFISTDGGMTWREANTGLPNKNVNDLVIDPENPSTIYVVVYGGIFQSTDGGESWRLTDPGTAYTEISHLTIDPLTPTTLYAVTSTGLLYKSTESAMGWREVNSRLSSTHVFTLVNDPLTSSIIYAGTNYGVFKSVDSGESWSSVNSGIEPWAPLSTPPADALAAPTSLPAPIYPTAMPMPPSPVPSPVDWRTAMDAFGMDSLSDTPLAGLTLAVRRPGEPDWIQAYGYADLEGSIPASADTLYQIGSLSMQFTAAAIMQLVERGQIDLYAGISRYLDGLSPELQTITMHQLLTHTSFIRDPVDLHGLFFSDQYFTSEMLLQEVVPMLYLDSNLETNFSYGNYILAGLILEQVSGMSYADYMNQYVFAPAGLNQTSYCLTPPLNMARGYSGTNAQLEPLPLNSSVVFAAGGLCSTVGDMLQWIEALTTGRVVSMESYQQMIAPIPSEEYDSMMPGYGLITAQDPEHGLLIFFADMGASYASDLVAYPEHGLTVVLLSNTAVPGNGLLEEIVEKIPILMP